MLPRLRDGRGDAPEHGLVQRAPEDPQQGLLLLGSLELPLRREDRAGSGDGRGDIQLALGAYRPQGFLNAFIFLES